MRTTRIALIVFLLLSCAVFYVSSAQAAWVVLRKGDLQKFTATFPGMFQEYRKLGLRIDPQKGKLSGVEKARRNQAVKKILADNGWNAWFWVKLQTIVRGYSLAKYDQLNSAHGANIEKFVRDLKKSRWMTPAKKAELEAFYAQIKHNYSSEAAKLRRQVHQKDLALIVGAMPELDNLMREVGRIQWEHRSNKRADW